MTTQIQHLRSAPISGQRAGPWQLHPRVQVITGTTAERLLRLYRRSVRILRDVGRPHANCSPGTSFSASWRITAIDKYVAWQGDGDPVGIVTVTRHLQMQSHGSAPSTSPRASRSSRPGTPSTIWASLGAPSPTRRMVSFLARWLRTGRRAAGAGKPVAYRHMLCATTMTGCVSPDRIAEYARRLFPFPASKNSTPRYTTAWTSHESFSPPRVAVVIEDDADIRNLLEAILGQAGFTCHTAADRRRRASTRCASTSRS